VEVFHGDIDDLHREEKRFKFDPEHNYFLLVTSIHLFAESQGAEIRFSIKRNSSMRVLQRLGGFSIVCCRPNLCRLNQHATTMKNPIKMHTIPSMRFGTRGLSLRV